MRRIYLKDLKKDKLDYNISSLHREFHHLKNVLRIKKGDIVEGFNGKGLCGKFKIYSIEKDEIFLKTDEITFTEKVKSNINIAVAVVKPKAFNFALKAAVQIGVNIIYPFISDYSYIKNVSVDKISKWNNVLIEAAKQCGINHLTFIEKIYTVEEISLLRYAHKYFFNLNGDSIYESDISKDLKRKEEVLLVIGPEGGFSKEEDIFFKSSGFKPVSLSFNILRTEVAVISILSILKYITGEA